jgi:hypothetical protein
MCGVGERVGDRQTGDEPLNLYWNYLVSPVNPEPVLLLSFKQLFWNSSLSSWLNRL